MLSVIYIWSSMYADRCLALACEGVSMSISYNDVFASVQNNVDAVKIVEHACGSECGCITSSSCG